MILYLSLEPFSLASQTDRTGPNAEINVDFFVAEKKVLVEMNAACQINILTLQYYWRVAGIYLSPVHVYIIDISDLTLKRRQITLIGHGAMAYRAVECRLG